MNKRYVKCIECNKVRNIAICPIEYQVCKICDDRMEQDYIAMMKAENEAELHNKSEAFNVFKSLRSNEDYKLLKEYIEYEQDEYSIYRFRIVDKITGNGIVDDDLLPLEVYAHQTCNGGYSGDDYSGTVYIKIIDNKYIAYDYSC